jgi:hypothetical protein
MMRISKIELQEFGRTFILANTPLSLFRGLARCTAMERLRRHEAKELLDYFDFLTARARRSEIGWALAYAILCAVLLRARDVRQVPIDESRLTWGVQIREYLARSIVSTKYSEIQMPGANVQLSISNSASAATLLLGPNGNPVDWRRAND